ncbi:hypothetical protein [Jonesia quinghaiensis]|uniref:hypothetical protein n=1 Tax=Jonesia quinghaiensis TaxID=262806 RepID=UPI001FDFB126|nr:hypothetical protein [Jonesia quinghaiensis]
MVLSLAPPLPIIKGAPTPTAIARTAKPPHQVLVDRSAPDHFSDGRDVQGRNGSLWLRDTRGGAAVVPLTSPINPATSSDDGAGSPH